MKQIVFSIIVPVYNASNFIRRCVDSIIKQDFSEYEVLLIDDCSTDDSAILCRQYESSDKRIHFSQNEINRGASATRNRGIKEARGEYLLFIDSDDFWLEDSVLSYLYNIVKEYRRSDFILFNRSNVDEIGVLHNWKHLPEGKVGMGKSEPVYEMTKKGIFPVSTGMKLYRKDFILENNLYFKEGVVWEDILYYYKILLCANEAFVCDKYFYAACYNSSSVSRNNSELKVCNLFEMIKECLSINISNSNDKYALYSILAYYYVILLSQLKYISESNKIIKTEIYSYKWLLNYNLYTPLRLFTIFRNIFGIKLASSLLSLYCDHKH